MMYLKKTTFDTETERVHQLSEQVDVLPVSGSHVKHQHVRFNTELENPASSSFNPVIF